MKNVIYILRLQYNFFFLLLFNLDSLEEVICHSQLLTIYQRKGVISEWTFLRGTETKFKRE